MANTAIKDAVEQWKKDELNLDFVRQLEREAPIRQALALERIATALERLAEELTESPKGPDKK